MNVVALQYDITWENREANFDTVRRLLTKSAVSPGSLIVLPEMFSTGFSMDVSKLAEGKKSKTEKFLSSLAWQYESHVIGGLVSRDPSSGMGRNELAVYDPSGRPVALYQKNYTFSYTDESRHYLPGDGLAMFHWHDFTVCPVICYDLRFPELFREGVRNGADLFTVSANWPVSRFLHWKTLLDARAIENLAYVVGVNRVGSDPRYRYPGGSRIVDHHGTLLVEAGDSEAVLSCELDHAGLVAWRREFPALDDIKDQAP
ncbi:MAG: carbon-nitrogen family hydrolase [Roseibacillus sp.]|nr:carbon-nitrogen family hydrolase [Roseibacillus sp.]